MDLSDKLLHALTQYDIKESKKQNYNHYALGQYIMALDMVMDEIKNGIDSNVAIINHFNNPIQAKLLKVVMEEGQN